MTDDLAGRSLALPMAADLDEHELALVAAVSASGQWLG